MKNHFGVLSCLPPFNALTNDIITRERVYLITKASAGAERYGVSGLLEQPRVATPTPYDNDMMDILKATGMRARARYPSLGLTFASPTRRACRLDGMIMLL